MTITTVVYDDHLTRTYMYSRLSVCQVWIGSLPQCILLRAGILHWLVSIFYDIKKYPPVFNIRHFYPNDSSILKFSELIENDVYLLVKTYPCQPFLGEYLEQFLREPAHIFVQSRRSQTLAAERDQPFSGESFGYARLIYNMCIPYCVLQSDLHGYHL